MEPGGSAPSDGDAWLLERSPDLAALERAAAAAQTPLGGRLVLVAGEAGVGKTALVRAFCAAREGTRVLWGACDALLTPRPLAPVTEIAGQADGELAKIVGAGAAPADLLAALAQDLRRRDRGGDRARRHALGRRGDAGPAAPTRPGGSRRCPAAGPRDLPRRAWTGRTRCGSCSASCTRPGASHRLLLRPLSPAAVASARRPARRRRRPRCTARTGGNPFFVTEVLAARGRAARQLPDTVRDAVLARAARLERAAPA